MRLIFKLIIALGFCYAIEWTASYFTQSSVNTWYPLLIKPSWNPPNLAFPIVWTILYTMIGISFFLIWCKPNSKQAFPPFFVQMFLNFSWSFAFFYLQSPFLGILTILVLLIAIIWNICAFWKYSKLASSLLFPYLLWVGYATTLNLSIWHLN